MVLNTDYYPFGSTLPGRQFNTPGYDYGHGGQLADDEITGSRTHYSAEYWEYDSRIGRRWNVDPITYAWQSPYATFNNNPIVFNDPKGLEGVGSWIKKTWNKVKAGLGIGNKGEIAFEATTHDDWDFAVIADKKKSSPKPEKKPFLEEVSDKLKKLQKIVGEKAGDMGRWAERIFPVLDFGLDGSQTETKGKTPDKLIDMSDNPEVLELFNLFNTLIRPIGTGKPTNLGPDYWDGNDSDFEKGQGPLLTLMNDKKVANDGKQNTENVNGGVDESGKADSVTFIRYQLGFKNMPMDTFTVVRNDTTGTKADSAYAEDMDSRDAHDQFIKVLK